MTSSEKSRLLQRDPYADLEANSNQSSYQTSEDQTNSTPEDNHNQYGEHVKSIVYGGLDGIITTFATVTSVAGADLSPLVVVVLGVAHLFADGLSMGVGDSQSTQAELDLAKSERRRERAEMQQNLHGEIQEMVDAYVQKGVKRSDAETVVRTLAKYPNQFLDAKMSEDLGMPPKHHLVETTPLKSGLITMSSFMVFGSVPLMPYLIALIPFFSEFFTVKVQLWSAIVMTIITLFLLGVVKGKVSAVKSIWWSGVQMAANGSFAAILGWLAGYLLGKALDLDSQVPPGTG